MAITLDHPSPTFDVRSELDPPELRVHITGELDFASGNAMDPTDLLDLGSVTNITVDLSGLQFIDIAGGRVLSNWHDAQTASRRVVTIVGSQRAVRRVFTLMGSEAYLAAA